MPRSGGKRRWLAFGFRADRAIAGDRPPRYGKKNVPFTVGRGPVPRRASIEETVGFRAFFARVERSRGTGPRATGQEGFSSPYAVRDQAIPNYGLLLIVEIL